MSLCQSVPVALRHATSPHQPRALKAEYLVLFTSYSLDKTHSLAQSGHSENRWWMLLDRCRGREGGREGRRMDGSARETWTSFSRAQC